jgi:hypothetical protein
VEEGNKNVSEQSLDHQQMEDIVQLQLCGRSRRATHRRALLLGLLIASWGNGMHGQFALQLAMPDSGTELEQL